MKTLFTTSYVIKEFNSFVDDKDRKCETGLTPEETFKNCLKTLPKRILKTWSKVSFNQDGYNYSVQKHWLVETNYDFHNSVLITKN